MIAAHDAPRNNDGIVNCAPWPTSYRAETDACLNFEPRLSRQRTLNVAPSIAGWFLADGPTFARSYYDIVARFRADSTTNYAPEYLKLIGGEFATNDANSGIIRYVANEHDFANLHRSVWLLMTHALARLLNFNLHGDWGDPPGGATTQGRYEDRASRFSLESFHTTPNLYGSYAIGSQDIPPPDLGVGAANVRRPPIERREQDDEAVVTGATLDLPDIARKIARSLADRCMIDKYGQHPYHRVVKSYYFDHKDHLKQYADFIGQVVHPKDDKAAAALAKCIGHDEFAEIHRGAWLFLAHRFAHLVGINPFGGYAPLGPNKKAHGLELPGAEGGPRFFEVPNEGGYFSLNVEGVDPEPNHGP